MEPYATRPLFDDTACARGPTDDDASMLLKMMLLSVAHDARTLPLLQRVRAVLGV